MNLRRIIAWWAALIATLGGCGMFVMSVNTPAHRFPQQHPTVTLTAQPATITKNADGSRTISATAYAQHAKEQYTLYLKVYKVLPNQRSGNSKERWLLTSIEMHDDGQGGDTLAGDGNWIAEYTVSPAEPADYEAEVFLNFPRREYRWQNTPVAQFSTNPRHDDTLPPHPSVRLADAELISQPQLEPGETLAVRARTIGTAEDGTLVLVVTRTGSHPNLQVYQLEFTSEVALYDDGTHGDPTAGDGEWHGAWANSSTRTMYATAEVELYFTDYRAQRVEVEGVTVLNPVGGGGDGAPSDAEREPGL